ncbi:SRPBCC family protein [Aeromicrobium sp. Leaf350]|uniref:SRPBCC family protein n=1 Tax=Aeromicrobium sp. Leaf350 TaxID=2876565 RepID=UPI001E2A24D0|nr:SRPBCC family protein [Aeromicrobium sp. Leaf350]
MPRTYVAPFEASIEIDAPPSAVWEVLADQRRMAAFSAETYKQGFIGTPLRKGTVSVNLNKRKAALWPTVSRYVEVVPERRLAFRVIGPGATWSYDLEPTADGGTLVTERRRLAHDQATFASIVTARLLLGGVKRHDDELLQGMNETLAQLKAEVEQA